MTDPLYSDVRYSWWKENKENVFLAIKVVLAIACLAIGGGIKGVVFIKRIFIIGGWGALGSVVLGGIINGLNSDNFFQGFFDGIVKRALDGFCTAVIMYTFVSAFQAHCFREGTLVETDEGKKPIEEINVGDKVLSYNEETGETAFKEVVRLFKNQTSAWICTEVEVDGKSETIKSTAEHPYFILNAGDNASTIVYEGSTGRSNGKWIAAKDLKPGYKCLLSNGKTGIIKSLEVEELETPETTYNFEVAEAHTYYVGENGILVHNDCISDELTRIANKHGDFKCVEAADEMKAFLQSKGINPNQVQIQFSGIKGRNFVYSDTLGRTISYNGYHTGIVYKGMVYDNLFKTGMAYNSWIDDFVGFGTRIIF